MWTRPKDFGMTQQAGMWECHQVSTRRRQASGGARQRRGVTYSCVRLEFYPNYNRFYQISAEIGHTPLHSFNLHTSPMAGLPGIDGTWLERPVRDVYVSLFSAPSIWECVGRHFTVTLLTGWQGWLETVRVSCTMTSVTTNNGAQHSPIFTTFLSLALGTQTEEDELSGVPALMIFLQMRSCDFSIAFSACIMFDLAWRL